MLFARATHSLTNKHGSFNRKTKCNVNWLQKIISIYKPLQSNEEINMTNGSFISTSMKTGIVLHLMTTNNKKRIRKEIKLRKPHYS